MSSLGGLFILLLGHQHFCVWSPRAEPGGGEVSPETSCSLCTKLLVWKQAQATVSFNIFFLIFLLQVYFISYPKPHQVGFTDDGADCSPGNPRDSLTISLLICPHLVHHQVLLILLPKHLWTPSIATITTLVQIPSASLLPAMLATFNPFLVLLESFVSSENHIRPPL